MRIGKIAAAAVVLLAAVSATVSAGTREEALALRAARIVAQLEAQPELVAAARAAAMTREQPDTSREKAVSKVDKNSFTLIGNVFFYDADFLSDGTPITVGVATVKRPALQDIYFSCLGSLASTCRALGRRQLEGWLLAGDGVSSDEFLHFLIVTKVKK